MQVRGKMEKTKSPLDTDQFHMTVHTSLIYNSQLFEFSYLVVFKEKC